MALLHIPFDQIDQRQLQRLIEAKAAESRDIEYKQASYGNADADHAEFLADISSFANTAGGDLIFGMAATKGVPNGFVPFSGDADAEMLRFDNMARSGLQPRVAHLRMKAVPLSQGANALVIRIPRSYNPPHRIIRQGKWQHRFFARSSAGKYEPNVDELRALFILAPQLADRIREFRIDRVAKIAAGEAPVPLMDRHCLVIHLVPFSAFDIGAALSLPEVEGAAIKFPPLYTTHPVDRRVNFDGVLLLSNADEKASQQRAYVQVFRSGVVEAVASSILAGERPQGGGSRLTSMKVEGAIVKYTTGYTAALASLGVEPPYAVLVSLMGVKGVPISFGVRASPYDDPEAILDRDQFHFAEVLIEAIPKSKDECATMLRPLLDQVANAAGLAQTPTFGADGKYQLFTA